MKINLGSGVLQRTCRGLHQQARQFKTDVETIGTSGTGAQNGGATRDAWLLPRPRFALVMVTLMLVILGIGIGSNFFKNNASSAARPQAAPVAEQSPRLLGATLQAGRLENATASESRDIAVELQNASRQLAQLRSRYTEEHPTVVAKLQEVERLERVAATSAIESVSPPLASLPPVVVQTSPISGARDVAPGIIELSARFSTEMADGSWSWCTAWDGSMPETVEESHYLPDHRTCVIKAKLEPGRTYAAWLNSGDFNNFRDTGGTPAIPYLLIFQTSGRTPPPTREGRWREDIDYLVATLDSGHRDFAKLLSRESFKREISELKAGAGKFSDTEIVLRLMRQIAGLGAAHAELDWRSDKFDFHFYPLRLHWFADGLAIVGAAEPFREAVGTRVVRIGPMTPKQVERAVTPYIPHENDAWLHEQSPNYMVFEELFAYLKIVDGKGRIEFTLQKKDGKQFVLEPPGWPLKAQTNMVNAWNALQIPIPLYRKQPNVAYWYEHLGDAKTLYIQYNKCQNVGQPFEKFAREALSSAESHKVERTVVDLRFNAGGDSRVVKPLIEGLKSQKFLSAEGRLYALIGPVTYSSGMMAAMDFKEELHAILIGEPTGGKPNSFGEVKRATLPNSNIAVYYPTKYFRPISDADPVSIMPDVVVRLKLEDFLTGRDPVLETALSDSRQLKQEPSTSKENE